MKNMLMISAATTLLLGASAGWAQQAEAPAGAAEESQTAPAQTPETPKERLVEKIGEWQVFCVDEGEVPGCMARQTVFLSDKKEEGPALDVYIEKKSAEAPSVLSVGTPLGVLVQPGVSILLDENAANQVWHADFVSCMPNMCLATGVFSEDIAALIEKPIVSLVLSTSEPVGIPITLDKFAEAGVKVQEENEKLVPKKAENETVEPAGDAEKTPVDPAAEAPKN